MIRKGLGLRLSLIAAVCSPLTAIAQQPATAVAPAISTSATTVVPKLVNYSGLLSDLNGKPLTNIAGVTFSLYKDSQGGAPLWMETQSVQASKSGHYSVMLGSTTSQGLPEDVFVSGEARWLGVQVQGQAEQSRVLLVAVPYALKARDAETIGGLPPSAFMLAAPAVASTGTTDASATSTATSTAPPPAAITGSGTANFVPLFTGAATIGNSVLFQSGTGATAKFGVNTITPATTLDVKGSGTIRGVLSMPAISPATTVKGFNSQPLSLVASAFNSASSTAVSEYFNWQSEPTGNNTATTAATLNLLFGAGAVKPVETGLKIANNGQITFAAGQTFPGAGTGTVTSVGSGAGLTGGPITGSGSLSIAGAGVTNAMLQNPSLTVNASSPLTGGGAVSLGGSTSLGLASCASGQILKWSGSWACASDSNSGGTVTNVASGTGLLGGPITSTGTLSVNPAVVAELAVANTFSNNQNVAVSNDFPAFTVSNSGNGNGISSVTTNPGSYNILATGGFEGVSAWYQPYPVVAVTQTGVYGVYGENDASANGDAGLFGLEAGTSGTVYGVLGVNGGGSPNGAGVYGLLSTSGSSTTGAGWTSDGAGVWGDGGPSSHYGVVGTTDNHSAGVFYSKGSSFYTLYASNFDVGGYSFGAFNGVTNKGCNIDPLGNLSCSGSKNAVVSIDGGQRKVALSAIESPKNWFEDFGSEHLSNGVAVIQLEADFAQTVNTQEEYHVFLTPGGDCKGLYVTRKTSGSFEVREIGGGKSSVSFDYRIVALRKDYETIRMADHTQDPDPSKMPGISATPTPMNINRMIPPKPGFMPQQKPR